LFRAPRFLYALTLIVVLGLLLGPACADRTGQDGTGRPAGGQDAPGRAAPREVLPLVDDAGRSVDVPLRPRRVVCLSVADVRFIYAIGGRVIGRPSTRLELPPAALDVPEVGPANNPDLEAIVALAPDLVVAAANPQQLRLLETLEEVGIPAVVITATTCEDTRRVLDIFGRIWDRKQAADLAWESIDSRIAAALRRAPSERPRVLALWGGTESVLAALPSSYIGDLLNLFECDNIAAGAEPTAAGGRYASISLEEIVSADPDAILVITHGHPEQAAERLDREFRTHPAWAELRAVKEGRVHELPFALFNYHPGTEIATAVEELARILWPGTQGS